MNVGGSPGDSLLNNGLQIAHHAVHRGCVQIEIFDLLAAVIGLKLADLVLGDLLNPLVLGEESADLSRVGEDKRQFDAWKPPFVEDLEVPVRIRYRGGQSFGSILQGN